MTRIIRYEAKQYELQPEGVQRARLSEINDLEPTINSRGKEQERIRFVWESNQVNSSGYPFKVWQTFNLTLHPKSFLSKAISDITGKEAGEEFDIDSLIGVVVDLVIKHNEGNDGRVYANVVAIMRLQTKAEGAEEKRVAAATAKVKQNATGSRVVTAPTPAANAVEIVDEDIPF